MNDSIRAALVNVIKASRQKMSRAQRQKGIKTQRWLYPLATEKRYAATIRAWLRPMKEYVYSYLKENQTAILRGDSVDGAELHLDSAEAENISVTRLDAVPGKSFKTMIDSLNGWLGQYVPTDNEAVSGSPIYMGLGKIADSVFDFNEGQFEKGAKSVLGVEFPVGEDWWPDARDLWAYNNYQAISGDMYKYVHDINELVERAVTSGQTVKALSKQIMALDDKITKGRANFIARDQIGKLNGQITQRRMESVGLSMYVWDTSGDERVRPSHELIDGGLCRWDDSTVFSQDGGKTWIDRPAGAVNLHPGMDYQCRCTAIAYWQELVDEADVAIDQYEELDTLSAQNIAAMPKPLTPTKNNSIINMGSLEQMLGKDFTDEMKAKLQNAPPEIQTAWNNTVSDVKVIDANYKRGAHYSLAQKGVLFDSVSDRKTRKGGPLGDMEPAHSVAFHEFFHNISHMASSKYAGGSWFIDFADIFQSKKHNGMTLTQMLQKEADDRISGLWKSLKADAVKAGKKVSSVSKRQAYLVIDNELKKSKLWDVCDVSDMWEGCTKGKASDHSGHGKSYWKDHTVGTEAFAEMGKATINHPESLAKIQEYFPKSYEIFKEMLVEIGGLK